MQSGDTGVSLNPGLTVNNDEQHTQSSQSSIHACNGNSFLELPNKLLNICHYNIWATLILLFLPTKRQAYYHDYYDIANLFNEHFANISSHVQWNHFSDPPDWDCSADHVDTKLPSGISCCIPPISENFVRTSLQQPFTGKATGLGELGGYFLKTAASSIS